MRILLLRRQALGGIATHTNDLATMLGRMGFAVTIEDAEKWIPNETSIATGRRVSKALKELGDGFDLVHAFGYRPAWACSEAYGYREAWVYTAYDMPKTTHRLLIDNLNNAQVGMCCSRAIWRELDSANATSLKVVQPGIATPSSDIPDRDVLRQELGIGHRPLVVGLGRFAEERGFDALIAAMEDVWPTHPETHLIVAGDGPQSDELKKQAAKSSKPSQVTFKGPPRRPLELLQAADLVVVPSRRAGFSMAAGEAMSLGQAVLLRRTGGLPEMVEEEFSGFLFNEDEDLGPKISDLLSMPLTRETAGSAARTRAQEVFNMERCAEDIAQVYRDVLS